MFSKVTLMVHAEAGVEEGVYVVGDCPVLGQWCAQGAVAMEIQGQSDTDPKQMVWQICLELPRGAEVSYRFFVGTAIVYGGSSGAGLSRSIEVILWETNMQPRHLVVPDADEVMVPQATFGCYGGSCVVSQGWLEHHQSIHVRFHSDPLIIWKPKYRRQLYSIKCSPLIYEPNEVDGPTESQDVSGFMEDSSLDGPTPCQKTAMLYYNLNQADLHPAVQGPTGCIYNKGDYLVFTARGFNQVHLGFQLDIFVHEEGNEARFVGSAHLLPPAKDVSLYCKKVPVIGLNHRPIGEIQVETLRVAPMSGYRWTMDLSYQNHWKWRREGETLNVGHRGMGSSYKSVANTRENTVRSLYAAARQGADFVEFDVLLSKDLVPVIYHDFTVCLATMKRKSEPDFLQVPVKDLNLKHLQSLRLFHSSSSEMGSRIELTEDECHADDQPFPTLQQCLEQVDPHVGFNIEIKFPQLVEGGEHEMDNYFDLNLYMDQILDIIFKFAGDRKIVFSTFHADCCILLNLKQNLYPTLFLVNGPTKRYQPYTDWRGSTFQHAIAFARAQGLLGVNFQAEGLLGELDLIPYVQSLGLVLFVWGEDLNEPAVKQTLRGHQVDAIIFDRMGSTHPDSFIVKATDSLEKLTESSASNGNAGPSRLN